MIELRKLKDEKEPFLYQWDTRRDVVITPKAGYHVDSIEWWNGTTELAPEGIIREEDGLIVSEIPNEFLQSSNSIHVRAVMRDGDNRRIIKREILTVIPCAKPAGYVYTPTEIKTWHALDKELKQLADDKLDKNQGKENAGKLLFVSPDGTVQPLTLGDGLEIKDGVLCITSKDVTTSILGDAILGDMILG